MWARRPGQFQKEFIVRGIRTARVSLRRHPAISSPWCLILTFAALLGAPLQSRADGTPSDTARVPRIIPLRLLHGTEAEVDFYMGTGGYRHAGLAVTRPFLGTRLGFSGHFVREEPDEPVFPSIGLEIGREITDGLEMELFGFRYLPVEDQHAWGLGTRVTRTFPVEPWGQLSLFVSPVYARVQALEAGSQTPATVGHAMLLGGVVVDWRPVAVTLFGSRSLFDRNPHGLETHVDLEELTHFAAYENTDGFIRASAGAEVAADLGSRLNVIGTYAAMRFHGLPLRHSTFLRAGFDAGRFEFFGGWQVLRGGQEENDIMMVGIALPR